MNRRLGLIVLVVLTLSPAGGCAFKPHPETLGTGGSDPGGGTGGSSVFDAAGLMVPDAPREYVSSTDGGLGAGPSADANCQNQPFSVAALPPDLLIVLDRSGSMNEDSSGMGCMGMGGRGGRNMGCGMNSKWYQVTTAINNVVAMTEGTINWGLKFFGNDMACGVTAGATVPPAPMNALSISNAIADPANQPGSSTPTQAGELSAGEYLNTLTDPNPRFVLLATDGQPNCAAGVANTTDDMAAIESVATVKTMGFPTFVIGIATAGGMADMTLNSMAMNGGYPLTTGTTQYYSVSTTAQLMDALAKIQTVTTGMCTYPLEMPGPEADPTKVTVTVDSVPSVKDDANGWRYDPGMKSITFTGTTCEQLMAGTLKKVQVLYGCKIGII